MLSILHTLVLCNVITVSSFITVRLDTRNLIAIITLSRVSRNAASSEVFKHGGDIQLNIEKLRGHGIGFVAGLHKWTELRPGVRSSFMFISVMAGANFPGQEQPKLYRFNRKFEKLQPGQVMIAFPGRTLTDVLNLPLYPEGKEFGYLYYVGKLPTEKKTKIKVHTSQAIA